MTAEPPLTTTDEIKEIMKKLEDYLYYEEKNPDLKIYCGDCLEILPLLPKVDLVVTDPPYGIGINCIVCHIKYYM